MYPVSVFPHLANTALTVLCVGEAWLGLNHCLVNSFRLPMMLSVTLHNEVQAWMWLIYDRGSGDLEGGGLSCCCLGRSTSITTVQCYCVCGKYLWHRHEHCSGSCWPLFWLSRPYENRVMQLCISVLQRPAVSVQFGLHPTFGLFSCYNTAVKIMFQPAALVQ